MTTSVNNSGFVWQGLPQEIQLHILPFLQSQEILVFRLASKSLRTLIDTCETYWTNKIAERYCDSKIFMHNIKFMKEFTTPLAQNPPSYFKIYTVLLQSFFKFKACSKAPIIYS